MPVLEDAYLTKFPRTKPRLRLLLDLLPVSGFLFLENRCVQTKSELESWTLAKAFNELGHWSSKGPPPNSPAQCVHTEYITTRSVKHNIRSWCQ